jgi:hypothetical protein
MSDNHDELIGEIAGIVVRVSVVDRDDPERRAAAVLLWSGKLGVSLPERQVETLAALLEWGGGERGQRREGPLRATSDDDGVIIQNERDAAAPTILSVPRAGLEALGDLLRRAHLTLNTLRSLDLGVPTAKEDDNQ